MSDASSSTRKRLPGWVRPVVMMLVIVAIVALGKALDAPALLRAALVWVEQLGWIGIAVFVLLYVLACIIFLPGSVLTLGAGVVFGVVQGSIIVSVASTLGATAAFVCLSIFRRE